MAYIANRPVRFDRDYAIGEIIPDKVIDPGMIAKLEGMGKISNIDLPSGNGGDETATENDPQEVAGSSENDGETDEVTDIPQETEEALTGENEAPDGDDTDGGDETATGEFKCEKCGKVFKTANALSAHSRSHKK